MMLPRFIRHRFILKTGAVLIAVLFWLYVKSELTMERSFSIPLQVHAAHTMSVIYTTDTISVILKGQKDVLQNIDSRQISASIDLSRYTERTIVSYQLTKKDFVLPGLVTLASWDPDSVEISLDKISAKNLPVEIDLKGLLPQGYQINSQSVLPATVSLRGPTTYLEKITSLSTTPIDLEGLTGSYINDVPLALPYNLEQYNRQKSVKVFLKIEKTYTSKTFESIPVRILSNPNDQRQCLVSPASVKITAAAPEIILNELKPQEIRVYVNTAGLNVGTYTLPVLYDTYKKIQIKDITPKEIEVSIQ